MMHVELFTVGPLFTNCYIATCLNTKESIIIDPGFKGEREGKNILDKILEKGLKIKYILNTHGHPDHTSGNGIVKKITKAPILIHELDARMLGEEAKELARLFGYETCSPKADITLNEGDTVNFGNIKLRVLHTPGHSKGSISLIGENCVFTGDTLFAGSIGRYDFPDSSLKELVASLKKLMILPENFIVYPGHGPITTIGEEKRNNPFLQPDFLRNFREYL